LSNFLLEIATMKKYFYIALLSVTFIAATARAQNLDLGNATTKVARVDDAQIATLQNLRPRSKTVVYLGASAAALQKDAASLSALQKWIKDGGVTVVYSDAATLFGFQLQAAREGTAQKGGQLYGRAEMAAPFGSEPLLWNTAIKTSANFGGMTVFYQMKKGDSLLFANPSAVPLLRVTDLADPQTKLFAAAVASYGNGWVVFAPRQLETSRAQGDQFWNNVLRMADDPPLPVDISALTVTASSLTGNNPDYKPLLADLQKRLDGKWPPANAALTELMPDTFPVARPIAQAMVKELQAATSPRAQKRLNAIIDLWMTQADLQRATSDSATAINAASKWLEDAERNAPKATEVLFWKGVIAAQNAGNDSSSSASRAKSLNDAAADWEATATARPLLAPVSAVESTFANSDLFGNPTSAMSLAWAKQARRDAAVIANEPSGMTLVGSGDKAVIVRHSAADATLRLALPAVKKLQAVSTDFGWIVPDEQVLIFPNESAFGTYGTALMDSDGTSFGNYGRVWQQQLLMVSQPSEPVIIPGTPERIIREGRRNVVLPGTKSRVVQAGTAAAAVLGRMHAEALIDALDEDGGKIPVWMQLGMMSLGGDAATGNKQAPTAELQQAGAANKLLSADRFNAGMLSDTTANLADAEALSLMTYFYEDFGAGSVMETIQRIASGQSANEALTATTGMDENEFFKAWYAALSGSRNEQRTPAARTARRTTARRRKAPKITNKAVSRATITRF
jgi:hypothetical protein